VTGTLPVSQLGLTDNYIISFIIPGQIQPATINNIANTVTVTMPYGTDLTNLTPEIQVSPGATISPLSGTAQNFTNPVQYTVTPAEGTPRIYTVTVTALTNAAPPYIMGQPQNANVNLNQPVTLSVTAASTDGGTLTYQWQYAAGASGGDFIDIPGADSDTYNPNTSVSGVNLYRVIITNTNLNVSGVQTAVVISDTATVTVNIPSFAVTVLSIGLGASGSGSFAEGEVVNISAGTPPANFEFVNWTAVPPVTFTNGTSVYDSTASFIMPNQDVIVTANFEPIPPTVTGVTVTPGSVTVQRGTTFQFNATVHGLNNPGQTVIWSVDSTDGSVVNTEGVLSVIYGETAEILTVTATSTVDPNFFGTATVTVSDDTQPEPTIDFITIYPSIHTMNPGGTFTFNAVAYGENNPPQGFVWTVEGGMAGTSITNGVLVIAPDETAAALTVRAASTLSGYTHISGTATVTVVQLVPVHISVINISGVTTTAMAGIPVTLAGTVNPSNASYQTIIWSVFNAGGTGANIAGNVLNTTSAGTVTVQATIINGTALGISYAQYFQIVVNPPSATVPSIITTSLSNGTAGILYSQTLAAAGTMPISWNIINGNLPNGLTLSNTGVISGTPTASGTFNFTVQAANSAGSATRAFAVVINPAQQINFTVSFNLNGGTRIGGGELAQIIPPNGQATAPAVTRSGYTFNGWDRSFNNVTENMVINAIWSWIEPWIIPESTPIPVQPFVTPAPTQTPTGQVIPVNTGIVDVGVDILPGGNVNLQLQANQLSQIMSTATGTIDFDLSDVSGAISFSMPVASVRTLGSAGQNLQIVLPVGTVIFGQTALANITRNVRDTNANITVTVTTVSPSRLTDAQRASVGNNPVFELTVFNGVNFVTEFGAPVEVRLPYVPWHGEDINALVVYYVDANGELKVIRDARFDPETGEMVFSTTHFSRFVITYNPVSFSDISGHWAAAPITQSAAKNMMSGYPDGTFKPNDYVTRAEFIQMLVNALDLPMINMNGTPVYIDVTSDMWFYQAVGAAMQARLLTGIIHNNTFNPNDPITRLEMADILGKIASSRRVSIVGSFRATGFSDFSAIYPGTVHAVELAINVGFLNENGMGNGRFEPNGYVTRAQAAAIQATVLQALGRPN
jgi:hypothetical protein